MVRHYIPRKPTAQQKEAAHNLYNNDDRSDDDIASDLPWTDEQHAHFRREAGLDDAQEKQLQRAIERDSDLEPQYREVAEQVRCRPSRSATRAFAASIPDTFNGQLRGREAVLRFVRAGNATVTVVSKVSSTRYTYRFERPKDWEQREVAPTFCKVLTGPENSSDYEFVGTMWPEDHATPDGAQVYRHSSKSRIGLSAPSVRALVWFLRTALHPQREGDLEMCEVWHEGRCGRCGRKLTVPSSVESGYGPECAGRM